ncbi:MAG: glyceraldehyde 3-phosphate dehydrogenase [Pseudoalteromonas tetraodonis]|jgi:glyceraldehyde 3-phosphate dehydrogenase|uniref:Glyceraldehyde-3-phosphate dehydrogenase n=3 Tax=Pseudoalteromonas TaxID=53246 RepID=A0AA37S298_9GAMM|nr:MULTISPECIES: type I glyceraldehyde-3-phosphate dehydrogenase [Pseudoalteromonas]MAY58520.1 type I glyceraldehyde-3-phosphate dehydrogenase [Pseudoalteromonas sp.]ADT68329.1 glyceraldehyde 3-phosphate dehydrogenase [Pseudoalteromonas sp. SM9913]ALQ54661.1 Glyceraldehyde-3-phosphate dehydrogenase [Pseudoalteromonas issachenkonii]ATC90466.1 glyceraldehyde 3-phosphate dehydrogenase [Pseudoalteromonas issachenkonii]ATD03045.1 glyceraldehyde 3-phosphate dehydrogenase [Pseudoalteromonas tetraodon|tara:strand:- start:28457 stop:29461 length:1005 start_codon:yes stop_codon:yes gene_type:complete
MINVAINGYGRIGRNVLRALYESAQNNEIKIVAINDLAPANVNAHLTQFDSVHGRFSQQVTLKDNTMLIGDDVITLTQERDPANLPWKALNVDIVLECTGLFTSREAANKHIEAGAKKVVVSAPGTDMDATVVHGVNSDVINADSNIISNASCTTNCLAPVAKAINDTVGIEQGSMTTIHAYTNDQNLSDVYHPDLYRARSATQSMIPTKTGAAKAVGLVLPELAGKLDGMAVRVPTINVSLVDLTFIAKRDTSIEEINQVVKAASEGPMKGILEYNELPLVSIDFNHNPASSIFDATQTRADGKLVKVMAWYDNEWGFSNRMLDQVKALGAYL